VAGGFLSGDVQNNAGWEKLFSNALALLTALSGQPIKQRLLPVVQRSPGMNNRARNTFPRFLLFYRPFHT